MEAKKRFLRLYIDNALEIDRLSEELDFWERRAAYGIDVSEITAVLQTRATRAAQQREAVERAIAALRDDKLRMVMTLRYIYGMKWEEIEDAMHLEYRWLLRLHSRALQQIEVKPLAAARGCEMLSPTV